MTLRPRAELWDDACRKLETSREKTRALGMAPAIVRAWLAPVGLRTGSPPDVPQVIRPPSCPPKKHLLEYLGIHSSPARVVPAIRAPSSLQLRLHADYT